MTQIQMTYTSCRGEAEPPPAVLTARRMRSPVALAYFVVLLALCAAASVVVSKGEGGRVREKARLRS